MNHIPHLRFTSTKIFHCLSLYEQRIEDILYTTTTAHFDLQSETRAYFGCIVNLFRMLF